MEQIAALLKEHVDNHPGLETVDAVKFLYQSYLGPGHLVPSESASLARLTEELKQCGPDFGEFLTQPLGNGLCRLNLRQARKRPLPRHPEPSVLPHRPAISGEPGGV